LGLLFLNKLFSRLFFQEVFFMSEFMKAGDPVWISPYDVTWPERFAQLAQPLRQALGPVAWRIDHIGSTAVAGLAAKPVIDIQISVADFEPLDAYRLPLERLGYIFRVTIRIGQNAISARPPVIRACIST
jgi:GrpB-like predicted nucleotidyltransferase (UPF0157 family)